MARVILIGNKNNREVWGIIPETMLEAMAIRFIAGERDCFTGQIDLIMTFCPESDLNTRIPLFFDNDQARTHSKTVTAHIAAQKSEIDTYFAEELMTKWIDEIKESFR